MPMHKTLIDTGSPSPAGRHRVPVYREPEDHAVRARRRMLEAAGKFDAVCRAHGIQLGRLSEAEAFVERLSPRGAKPGDAFPLALVRAAREFARMKAKCTGGIQ